MQTVYEQMQADGARLAVKRAYILGRSTPMDAMSESHTHDSLEIIYVNCDRCRFVQGGSAFVLNSRDLVMYRSAVPHRIEWIEPVSRPLFGLTLECIPFDDGALSCAHMLRSSPILREFFVGFDNLVILNGAEALFQTMYALVRELLDGSDAGYEMLLLNRLLIDIARANSTDRDMTAKYVKQVRQYIDAKYAAIGNMDEIASAIGLTKNHIQRLFKARTGQTVWQYLTGVRLMRAEQLLVHTDAPIGEVGARVGISSRQNFGRLFQRAYGAPPLAYRIRSRTEKPRI